MKRSKKKGKEALDEALLKVAVGYSVEEVTEEYAEVDGEMKLMKRKETKKDIPPDLKAVQLLLADVDTDFSKMSDEDLERERDRLLAELEMKKGTAVGGSSPCTAGVENNSQESLVAGRYATNEVLKEGALVKKSEKKGKSAGKSGVKNKSVKKKTGGVKAKKKTGKEPVKKNKEGKE